MDDWGFDLYYYGARYMDPTTGRFITPDPVKDYLNQYSYVGNNPVNRVDPTGMSVLPFERLPGQCPRAGGKPLFYADLSAGLFKALTYNPDYEVWKAKIKVQLNLMNAYLNATQMAESNLPSQIKSYWQDLATELGKRLKNFDKYYKIEKGENGDGRLWQTDDNGKKYEVWGYEQGGVTHIGYAYANSASDLSLQATIIHEASHTVYDNRVKGEDYNKHVWRESAQQFTRSREFEYYNFANSQGFWVTNSYDKTMLWWARNYNEQAKYFFNTGNNFWDELFKNDPWVSGGEH